MILHEVAGAAVNRADHTFRQYGLALSGLFVDGFARHYDVIFVFLISVVVVLFFTNGFNAQHA